MTASSRRILLVNPFIYDFAAHDAWAKPKGLLDVGRLFLGMGHEVSLLDCLDNRDPDMAAFTARHTGIERPRPKKFGTGSYFREEVEKTGRSPGCRAVGSATASIPRSCGKNSLPCPTPRSHRRDRDHDLLVAGVRTPLPSSRNVSPAFPSSWAGSTLPAA